LVSAMITRVGQTRGASCIKLLGNTLRVRHAQLAGDEFGRERIAQVGEGVGFAPTLERSRQARVASSTMDSVKDFTYRASIIVTLSGSHAIRFTLV